MVRTLSVRAGALAKPATCSSRSSSQRSFSSTPMRTPVRRYSSGAHPQSSRPSFLRPLSSLAPVTLAPKPASTILSSSTSSTKVKAAESVHLELARNRNARTRSISSTHVNQIEQTPVVEAEGDMATTQDHVVIDVSVEARLYSSEDALSLSLTA